VNSWRRGGLGGEVLKDDGDDDDRNRSPELLLRTVASVTDGYGDLGRKQT
jgi:hypothetical protein